MTDSVVKPWVCRLYPVRGSVLFARVQVWPTKKAFLAHVNATHHAGDGRGFSRRCDGTCSRYHVTSFRSKRDAKNRIRGRRHPCFAVVNMWRGRCTMSVVTHELFHATVAWGHRTRFPFFALDDDDGVSDIEERITYVHSELCRQFMMRALSPGGPYVHSDTVSSS